VEINKTVNGKKEGLWKYHYPNGKLWYEGHYREDKKDGLWKEYDENGVLIRREVYLL